MRAFVHRCKEIIRYWVFFYWFTDLRLWFKRAILDPLFRKFLKFFNAFIYVVGCYWVIPVLKKMGQYVLNVFFYYKKIFFL